MKKSQIESWEMFVCKHEDPNQNPQLSDKTWAWEHMPVTLILGTTKIGEFWGGF